MEPDAHPEEEMKKVLILGGRHHLFFSPHGSFMNEFVWVCGEHANVVDFFCLELQLKDLQSSKQP